MSEAPLADIHLHPTCAAVGALHAMGQLLPQPPLPVAPIPLHAAVVTVGRTSACTAAIAHPSISRRHFVLELVVAPGAEDSHTWYITDLSSRGTWLQGAKLLPNRRTALSQGDVIALADPHDPHMPKVQLEFQETSDAALMTKAVHALADADIASELQLLRKLGAGSFGSVWLAATPSGQACAVKIMQRTSLSRDAAAGRALENEIRAMHKFSFGALLDVQRFFVTPSTIAIQLEFAEGGDVATWLTKQPGCRANKRSVQQLGRALLAAIAHLHHSDVSHRDIKLENIVLTLKAPRFPATSPGPGAKRARSAASRACSSPSSAPSSELSPAQLQAAVPLDVAQDGGDLSRYQCKVADLGLATLLRGNCRAATVCGTPAYAAPELLLHEAQRSGYSKAVDVYAAGLCLYAAACGELPWDLSSGATALPAQIIASTARPWAPLENKHLWPELRDLLDGMLCDHERRLSAKQALLHPALGDTHAQVHAESQAATQTLDVLAPTRAQQSVPEEDMSQPLLAAFGSAAGRRAST